MATPWLGRDFPYLSSASDATGTTTPPIAGRRYRARSQLEPFRTRRVSSKLVALARRSPSRLGVVGGLGVVMMVVVVLAVLFVVRVGGAFVAVVVLMLRGMAVVPVVMVML